MDQPVTGTEVKQALGQEDLAQVATANGVDTEEAADRLAEELPGAVDRITPDGNLPGHDQLKEPRGPLSEPSEISPRSRGAA